MKSFIFVLLFAAQMSFASDIGPQLSATDNLCPQAMIDEVVETGKGRVDVIASLISQTTKASINCLDSNQGISMLSYLAETYHNDTMLQVIEQLKPNLNLQDKVRVYSLGGLTKAFRGDTALTWASRNDYIASDTMTFYLLDHGANPNLQDEIIGETALIVAADEGTTLNAGGAPESATAYRKLMYLRLFGANPNLQGWTQTQAPYQGSYADTVFHKLARHRGDAGVMDALRLLIEPRVILNYAFFKTQIPAEASFAHLQLSEERFNELLVKMPEFDARVLCLKDGAGLTVFDELHANVGVFNKAPIEQYLAQFAKCK